MTIPFSGSNGALFNRLGLLFGGLDDLNALRGGAATARTLSTANWVTRVANLFTYYASSPVNSSTLDGIQSTLTSWQQAQSGFTTSLQQLMQDTVIAMANADVPLASLDIATALTQLVTQMQNNAATVQASVLSLGAQTNVGTPKGSVFLALSPKTAYGLQCEYAIPETLLFTTSQDSFSGNATVNQEQLTVVGQVAETDSFAADWPTGSGASTTLTLTDGEVDNSLGGNNLLENGSFNYGGLDISSMLTQLPANWFQRGTGTIAVAQPGYRAPLQGPPSWYTAGGLAPSTMLQLTMAGAVTPFGVTQTFGTTPSASNGAGGTAAVLLPNTVYRLNGWIKASANPGSGTLSCALTTDTSSYTTIVDPNGVNNIFSKTLSGIGTGWVQISGTFVTPSRLPAAGQTGYNVTIYFPSLPNVVSVLFDTFSLVPMTSTYAGGPYAAGFSGTNASPADNPTALGDAWTMSVGNTWGLFQRWFQRAFGMTTITTAGLQLPSSGSPTISDSLIQ